MDTFRCTKPFFPTKLLTMAVLWTFFGVIRYLICGHLAKTADHGSSMDVFGPHQLTADQWQVHGHFSVLQESVHETADHCSSVDMATKLLTMTVL